MRTSASVTHPHRLSSTTQVSSAVCFLLSPGADYITGSTITVDGGWVYYKPNWNVPGEGLGIHYVPNLIHKASTLYSGIPL